MNNHNNPANPNSASTVFAVGLIAGAALAALYTPRSGQDTRSDLKRRISGIKHNVNESSSELKNEAQEKIEDAKKSISRSKDDAES